MPKTELKYVRKAILLLGGIAFFLSCENDIASIQAITATVNYPDVSGKDVRLVYTDSAVVKLEITASEVLQYDNIDEPYTDFPKGIYVKFYNKEGKLESEIKSDKAYYFKSENLWKAEQNVFAQNFETGEKLTTDELFWDEKKETVYSDKFSRIETPDGVFFGENGFTADQNLNTWQLKGSTGTVNVKENEEE
jgi:LPS export ABC transporter protein LptC